MALPDKYETRSPSDQNIADLFEGEWSSEFPLKSGEFVRAGGMKLFNDPRISWAENELGGFAGRIILELGPLEGGHTYMLHRGRASEIVAIEANRRAFLKCLCVKELYRMNNASFLLGDFLPYLETNTRKFDIVIASGVLYHMLEPVKTLDMMSRATDRLFIWTHYFDADIVKQRADLTKKFSQPYAMVYGDKKYECVDYRYNEALDWAGFTGGTEPGSRWLTRDTILAFLREAGFHDIKVNFEQRDHPHGPAFSVCAQR